MKQPPRTKRQRSIHSRHRLLIGLPLAGLVFLGVLLGLQSYRNAQLAARDERAVGIISHTLVLITDMVSSLQRERTLAALHVYYVDPKRDVSEFRAQAEKTEQIRTRFIEYAQKLEDYDAEATKQAVAQLKLWHGAGPLHNPIGGKDGKAYTIKEEREEIIQATQRTPQVMRFYRYQIVQLFDIAETLLSLIQDREMKETLYAYLNLCYLRDSAFSRDLAVQVLTLRKKFVFNEFIDLTKSIGSMEDYRRIYNYFAPAELKRVASANHTQEMIFNYQALVNQVNNSGRENKESTLVWADWETAVAPLNTQLAQSDKAYREGMLAKAAAMKSGEGRKFVIIVSSVIGVLLASALFARYIGIKIEKGLKGVVGVLNKSASSLARASTSTTAVSDTLSDEASRFAASMEEMSATTEEISSMLRQSATHAAETDTKTQKARETAQTDLEKIRQLATSMQHMDESSRKIAKIIKGIDEIAFQTNILALNAAIEAARAGEAGAGFAVVADEVRALAARSAQAAQESGEIISASTKETNEGRVAAQAVLDNFQNLLQTIEAIAQANSNIAASFQQQSQGVGQINESIVAQSNTAQHLAAASQEMSDNAKQLDRELARLRDSVFSLQALAGQKPNAADSAQAESGNADDPESAATDVDAASESEPTQSDAEKSAELSEDAAPRR